MCKDSRPFPTPVSHLLVVVAQTPSQNLLFQSLHFPPYKFWLSLSLLFFLSTTLPLLSAAFVSLCPLIYLKARPAGFGCFPQSPKRPVFTRCSSSCPLVSLPAESKGGSGLKGRTPDGHRHVGHVLCDGAWLRALWASHSCQS